MGYYMSKALEEKIIGYRRYLHQYPELSGEEFKTTEFIIQEMAKLGLTPLDLPLKTGVVFDIKGHEPGAVIALRADIDALPIEEATQLDYASTNAGVMHACGHDFHTASLLGAAHVLVAKQSEIKGTIRLIFQPSEELNKGAKDVIQAGGIESVDAIIGYHNTPHLPIGAIGIKEGPLFAAATHFKVTITGVGTHAAAPHNGNDPIVSMGLMITDIQSIVSRYISPFRPAVVSVTSVHAGNTWNVVPQTGFFEGTVRTFYPGDEAIIKTQLIQRVDAIATSRGQSAHVFWDGSPAVLNDATLTQSVSCLTKQIASVIVPEPTMGGEDFAHYLHEVPGVFALIGTNTPYEWHNPSFLVDDTALSVAVDYFVVNALGLTNEFTKSS